MSHSSNETNKTNKNYRKNKSRNSKGGDSDMETGNNAPIPAPSLKRGRKEEEEVMPIKKEKLAEQAGRRSK